MVRDQQRGWAWTRALLGVAANEVHVCGEGAAIELVREICAQMNEDFEVIFFLKHDFLNLNWLVLGEALQAPNKVTNRR